MRFPKAGTLRIFFLPEVSILLFLGEVDAQKNVQASSGTNQPFPHWSRHWQATYPKRLPPVIEFQDTVALSAG